MNDELICSELAAVLDVAPLNTLVPDILSTQAKGRANLPNLIVGIEEPLAPYGPRRVGRLRLTLTSALGDEGEGDANQTARFSALWAALFGAEFADLATAKAALQAALEARNRVRFIDYGPTSNAIEVEASEGELLTTVRLNIVAQFL